MASSQNKLTNKNCAMPEFVSEKGCVNKTLKYLCILSCIILTLYNSINFEITHFAKEENMKFILLWTYPTTEPFSSMAEGQNAFLEHNCSVCNCYITSDRKMREFKDFDAVLFHGPDLYNDSYIVNLPPTRYPHQVYVFVSKESSHNYPISKTQFDNFFNWTMTYRLDSEVYFGYVIIKNKQGDIIGPKKNILWLNAEEMEPINDTLIEELNHKKAAVSWIVSHCNTLGNREYIVEKMNYQLEKYNMSVDIYGSCGEPCNFTCLTLVKDYYFYLSFENSLSKDYVTEKLLTPLLNNAVPVVYGDADYTRFLPHNAYLNVKHNSVKRIVKTMVDAIKNKQKYYEFFKWRNHYSYHNPDDSSDTNYYCQLCNKLNELTFSKNSEDSTRVPRQVYFYKNFTQWWTENVDKKNYVFMNTLNR